MARAFSVPPKRAVIAIMVLVGSSACAAEEPNVGVFVCANGERVHLLLDEADDGSETMSWRLDDGSLSTPVPLETTKAYADVIDQAFANCEAPIPLLD